MLLSVVSHKISPATSPNFVYIFPYGGVIERQAVEDSVENWLGKSSNELGKGIDCDIFMIIIGFTMPFTWVWWW